MTESLWKNQTSLWPRWENPQMTTSFWKTRRHSHQGDISQNDKIIRLLWSLTAILEMTETLWKDQKISWPEWYPQNDRVIWNSQNVIMITCDQLYNDRVIQKNSHQRVMLHVANSRMTESYEIGPLVTESFRTMTQTSLISMTRLRMT